MLENPEAIEFRLAADADQFATLAKFRAMRLLWDRVETGMRADADADSTLERDERLAHDDGRRALRERHARRARRLRRRAWRRRQRHACCRSARRSVCPTPSRGGLARNTQLVELREARLGFVADPAAGAGGFEAMTEGLCEKAWALFQTFEAAGGLAKALEQGLVQSAVADGGGGA